MKEFQTLFVSNFQNANYYELLVKYSFYQINCFLGKNFKNRSVTNVTPQVESGVGTGTGPSSIPAGSRASSPSPGFSGGFGGRISPPPTPGSKEARDLFPNLLSDLELSSSESEEKENENLKDDEAQEVDSEEEIVDEEEPSDGETLGTVDTDFDGNNDYDDVSDESFNPNTSECVSDSDDGIKSDDCKI